MSLASFRQAELPGTSRLYADFLESFPRVGGFYSHPPSLDAAQAAASDISIDGDHRRRLVAELARQNAGADASTLESLDRLASAGTVAVTTGQQVGLLGGPVFTLYKALTAVRCAEDLTRRGVPAVPVFWMATEDHDLEEVNHAWAFSAAGAPTRLEAATRGADGAAVCDVEVADARLDQFAALCEGLPYGREAVDLARSCYEDAPGFGEGFRRLYRSVLAETGIIFMSPMDRGIRELAAPLMGRALRRAPDLADLLLNRGAVLQQAGYHQQVRFQASTSLVMLFRNAVRTSLRRRNGSYWADSQAYSTRDLLALLEQWPLMVSPSALLRPVMQDFLLPTAALIAGPSEAAYLAQSAVLYENLLGRMPSVLPRASFTVLDGGCAKLLRKYGIAEFEWMIPKSELEGRVAAANIPRELQDALESHETRIRESLQGIEHELRDFDPSLSDSFRVSRRKIEYQLSKTRSKVSRESLRRAKTARRHVGRLAGFLYPDGHLQERVYNVLSFVAKFGLGFVDEVKCAVEPGAGKHRVVEL